MLTFRESRLPEDAYRHEVPIGEVAVGGGVRPEKRINLTRPSARLHWKRSARRLCARR